MEESGNVVKRHDYPVALHTSASSNTQGFPSEHQDQPVLDVGKQLIDFLRQAHVQAFLGSHVQLPVWLLDTSDIPHPNRPLIVPIL